jgi:hypothetical protein
MDELEHVRRLLAQPPPSAEVVDAARASLGLAGAGSRADEPVVHLNGGRHNFGRPPSAHRSRSRRWLASAAAATAVIAVVVGSLAISGAFHRQAGPRPAGPRPAADSPAAPAGPGGVPRYFVALTGRAVADQGQHAEVVATATGTVLGSVTAPGPSAVFTDVAAAGDDRTFVLAERPGMSAGQGSSAMLFGAGPARLYELVLRSSGQPGTLTALPVSPVSGSISGLALSPDGSKLALSLIAGSAGQRSEIEVVSLATGTVRTWTLPDRGWVGWGKPDAQSLSWENDNRTLLFEQQTYVGQGQNMEVSARLLDTAEPGGNLETASRLVPIPSQVLTGLSAAMLITGDGTKIVAPTTTQISPGSGGLHLSQTRRLGLSRQCGAAIDGFTRQHGQWTGIDYIHYRKTASCLRLIQQNDRYFRRYLAPELEHQTPPTTGIAITEFSVSTGKPVVVLDLEGTHAEGGAGVDWTSTSGTSLVAEVPVAGRGGQLVIGVQDGRSFAPLPAAVQHALYEQAAW